TTAPLVRALLEAPQIIAGIYNIHWLEEWLAAGALELRASGLCRVVAMKYQDDGGVWPVFFMSFIAVTPCGDPVCLMQTVS
ncbi:MAG: hypothetical protein AAFV96_18150, partial [Pseudomonadota bacterium]